MTSLHVHNPHHTKVMTNYHETMCTLAREHYQHHILELNPEPVYVTWRLRRPAGSAHSARVEILPVAYGRLLVHGDCDPVVFGNYTQPVFRHHPLVHMIGEREDAYLAYVAGKTLPGMPAYYDEDTAHAQLYEMFYAEDADDRVRLSQGRDTRPALVEVEAEIKDRVDIGDWAAVQTYMHENLEIEGEDIARFGRVLAPPNFYYAVFAVKRLWEVLEAT